MKNYERKAYYHETDQMGVVHHSNYLKWMEEARIDFMDQLGFGYKQMEKIGIISPVVSVAIEYKNSVHFDDIVAIELEVKVYNGIRLELNYRIVNTKTGVLCATATSKHCFIKDGRIISLKKELPEFQKNYEKFFGLNED